MTIVTIDSKEGGQWSVSNDLRFLPSVKACYKTNNDKKLPFFVDSINEKDYKIYHFNLKDGIMSFGTWTSIYYDKNLFIEINDKAVLSSGIKDSFASLLDYAEEVLESDSVFIYTTKEIDHKELFRVLLLLGFKIVQKMTKKCPIPLSQFVFFEYQLN